MARHCSYVERHARKFKKHWYRYIHTTY